MENTYQKVPGSIRHELAEFKGMTYPAQETGSALM